MVLVGVIRNVEEILRQKPMARVVINGLLPFTFNRDGYIAKGGAIKPSVWADIQTINAELRMYATYRGGDRVTYFETDVFLEDPKLHVSQIKIDKELMPDYLHPSPAGYRAWGKEIVEALDSLFMNERDAEADDAV
jgi:lysophospholipase L1-like esterase